jgi:hypothetical protein
MNIVNHMENITNQNIPSISPRIFITSKIFRMYKKKQDIGHGHTVVFEFPGDNTVELKNKSDIIHLLSYILNTKGDDDKSHDNSNIVHNYALITKNITLNDVLPGYNK